MPKTTRIIMPFKPIANYRITYSTHRALSKLEFPIGNIYCIIPKKRTPSRFNYLSKVSFSYEEGWEQKALLFIVIWNQNRIKVDTKVLSKQQNFSCAFIKKKKFFSKLGKEKIVMPFFLKKVGGALIRVGALNRDYTVFKIVLYPMPLSVYKDKVNRPQSRVLIVNSNSS